MRTPFQALEMWPAVRYRELPPAAARGHWYRIQDGTQFAMDTMANFRWNDATCRSDDSLDAGHRHVVRIERDGHLTRFFIDWVEWDNSGETSVEVPGVMTTSMLEELGNWLSTQEVETVYLQLEGGDISDAVRYGTRSDVTSYLSSTPIAFIDGRYVWPHDE